MKLGRVTGTVVATTIVDDLDGVKLLMVEPLDHDLNKVGSMFVACDTVMAGPGDLIYWVASREASLGLDPWFVPVDATIIGIVDSV